MVNYKYGKIYKITSENSNLVYYGSTSEKYLSRRLSHHLAKYKSYLNGKGDYYTSFEVLKCEDYKMELIKNYPSANKTQLTTEESKYIRCNECVNKVIPDRTPKEYDKQYNQDNKKIKDEKNKQYYQDNIEKVHEKHKQYYKANEEKIKEKNKDYYEANKSKIKEQMSKPYHCECGAVVRWCGKLPHFKTVKHCQYINTPQLEH